MINLLVHGLGQDEKSWNEVIQNSKFKIIENAGHEVNIDNPIELANTIYDFWEGQ